MQLPGLNIGIVADDMTGANDTALQFFLAGIPTHVLLDMASIEQSLNNGKTFASQSESHVWSLNTDSRHLDRPAAEASVKRAVAILRDQFGVDNFYKKIDSTLRGHIAHECLSMLHELGADCAVIVPAFPQEKRRTVGGYQLIKGTPIERTQVVRDPLFPVRQSHIPTLLEQATNSPELVGYIPLSTVLHGAAPILVALSELVQKGNKLVVIDATSEEDLEQIALAIEKIRNRSQDPYWIIPCGSAGFAHALTKLWVDEASRDTSIRKQALSFVPSPILLMSGSSTDTTRQQLIQLIENYGYYGQNSKLEVFQLSPEQLLGLEPVTDILTQICMILEPTTTIIVTSALKDDHYARTIMIAKEHQMNEKQASRQVQDTLAKIAQAVTNQCEVKLILTGGETASRVCKSIGSQTLKILDQAQPAIPVCLDDKGHWIITKSGNFGEPLVLAGIIQFIKDNETMVIPPLKKV